MTWGGHPAITIPALWYCASRRILNQVQDDGGEVFCNTIPTLRYLRFAGDPESSGIRRPSGRDRMMRWSGNNYTAAETFFNNRVGGIPDQVRGWRGRGILQYYTDTAVSAPPAVDSRFARMTGWSIPLCWGLSFNKSTFGDGYSRIDFS
jgi:hypothetical protein